MGPLTTFAAMTASLRIGRDYRSHRDLLGTVVSTVLVERPRLPRSFETQ